MLLGVVLAAQLLIAALRAGVSGLRVRRRAAATLALMGSAHLMHGRFW
jgi:hypothetical protein